MSNGPDSRPAQRARAMRAVIEFAVVGGASLAALFWVIPAQTQASDNFGLSPRMVPMVCASLIGGLALFNLLGALLVPGDRARPDARGLGTVFALLAASGIGIAMVHLTGLVTGGTLLVLLASLVLGERRPLHLAAMGSGALALLLAVEWTGL